MLYNHYICYITLYNVRLHLYMTLNLKINSLRHDNVEKIFIKNSLIFLSKMSSTKKNYDLNKQCTDCKEIINLLFNKISDFEITYLANLSTIFQILH